MVEDEKTEKTIKVVPVTVTPKEYALQHCDFKPLFEPLGAIAFQFCALEATITNVINFMLGIGHADGLALNDVMWIYINKVKMFNTLASIKAKDILDGFLLKEINRKDGIRQRLDECAGFRNNYLHGAWNGVHKDGSFQKIRYRADKELKIVESLINVTVDDIWRAHQLIFDTSLSLSAWLSVYQDSSHPEWMPTAWQKRYELHMLQLSRRNKDRNRG